MADSIPEISPNVTQPVVEPVVEVQNSEVQLRENLEQQRAENIVMKSKADTQFSKAMDNFHAEQENLTKAAEAKLPKRCMGCHKNVKNKKDEKSIEKNGSCFGCFTDTETHKLKISRNKLMAEGYAQIGTLDLSDYEDWLFGDEMGERALARIMAKLKSEGYDYKPWQVSIGASAWSKDNYNDTSLIDTRHIVERVKIANLTNYIPVNTDGIQQVIASTKRAESMYRPSKPSSKKNILIPLGIFAALSITIPMWLRRR